MEHSASPTGGPIAIEAPAAPTSEERNWALLAHLSALSGYLAVPLGSVLGPLIVWLAKRDQSPFVEANAREALNFHLSMLIYLVLSTPLVLVLVGIPLLLVIPVLSMVMSIVAAIKSADGQCFRYPLTIRLVR